jgi:hypothetical protein
MLLLILGSHCHVQFLLLINSNHLLGLENFPPFSFQCKWKNGALDLSASPEKMTLRVWHFLNLCRNRKRTGARLHFQKIHLEIFFGSFRSFSREFRSESALSRDWFP